MKYLLLIFLSATALFANAQKVNPPLVKSTALYNKTIVQIKPAFKNYVTQTAKAFRHKKLNTDSLKKTIKMPGNALFSNLNDADISTLLYLVAQATEAAVYADIQNMMAAMEKNRKKKEALRKEEESINEKLRRAADSNKVKIPTYTDYAKRVAAIKKEKDAIDEMTEQDMLQLQQLMEKKSQLETMISNIMKAAGETLSGLSNNLKAS